MNPRKRPDFFSAEWDDQDTKVSMSTHIHYMEVANRLVRKFRAETGLDFSLEDSKDFLSWLTDLMNEVRGRTRSVYRSALRYAVGMEGRTLDLSGTRLARPEICKKRPPHQSPDSHPSAQRMKSATMDDVQRMLDEVFERKALGQGYKRNEHIAVLMLALSAQTGLRPIEWLDAHHDSANGLLVVKNAKASESKSFGEYRTLNIKGLEPEWVAAIDFLLERVAKYRESRVPRHRQMDYIRRLGVACRRVYDRTFPRRGNDFPRITLYSGRHMFAAAAKSDPDISDVELSAIMGHRSLVTVKSNYANAKRKAASGVKVRASDADIQAVRMAQVRAGGTGLKL
jgi:integrase